MRNEADYGKMRQIPCFKRFADENSGQAFQKDGANAPREMSAGGWAEDGGIEPGRGLRAAVEKQVENAQMRRIGIARECLQIGIEPEIRRLLRVEIQGRDIAGSLR